MRLGRALTLAVLLATASPVLAERPTDAPLVDAQWLQDHLQSPDLALLDIRDPGTPETDYALGHVPGALSAPFTAFGWDIDHDAGPPEAELARLATALGALGIGADTQVVVVTDGLTSADFARATRVYWQLKVMGHDAVTILDGGTLAWADAGLPLVTEVPVPKPASFPLTYRRDLLATTADLSDPTTLIDARTTEEHAGLRKSPALTAPGTIPGAQSLPSGALYDGRFLPVQALNDLVAAQGIAAQGPVVTFCTTGLLGSLDWFALSEVLGRPEVRLYDGSMQAWTADPARPLQTGAP